MKTVGVILFPGGAEDQWLHGISRYARMVNRWQPAQMGRVPLDPAEVPPAAMADGLIVSLALPQPAQIAALTAWGVPIVNLIQNPPPLPFPTVCADNAAAGRLAAEHLLALGLRRFGYVGSPYAPDNAFRRQGFENTIRSAGAECASAEFPTLWQWNRYAQTSDAVGRWIRRIGCPCGIFAFNDSLAAPMVRSVVRSGFRVPDDVAVVGVDDDPGLCELSNPPLSSVNLNNEVIAYEAAALLDRLMHQDTSSALLGAPTLIPPIGVIERQSSQMLAVEEDVAQVIWLMKQRIGERLTVKEMAEHVRISPRALGMKFHRWLGRSPSDEMSRLRLNRAKQLLVDTDRSITQIAHDAGFANAGHFCSTFKDSTRQTPTQYRRSIRGAESGGDL